MGVRICNQIAMVRLSRYPSAISEHHAGSHAGSHAGRCEDFPYPIKPVPVGGRLRRRLGTGTEHGFEIASDRSQAWVDPFP